VNLPARALEEFQNLLELGDDEVSARLREIEASDPDLGVAVRRLVEADRRPSDLLDGGGSRAGEPAWLARWADPAEDEAAVIGQTIGAYRTIRLLGRGGMGVVLLAERIDGQFEKQVALKLLRSGLGSADIQRRFLRERQILARLDHPNIARLLDGGVSADGRPYFVMEYVEGSPIDESCARRSADVEEVLGLLVLCCRAVATAHGQLVVHRDLKPSNILVTDAGELKLLDFGIAKVLEGESTEVPLETALTRVGAQLLTPRYAAPEQIMGEPLSTATDVYSLGVVLYELLTGALPHRRAGTGWAELAAHVSQEVVDRPSAALRRRLSAGAPAEAAEVTTTRIAPRSLEGDLDTILLKALDRDPTRRYPSAAALGDDLERYLQGRPVLARPDTAGYRVRKFVRRHRAGVAAAAIATLSLLSGLGVAVWQAQAARAQARRAEAAQGFLQNVFLLSDPDRAKGEKLTARDLLDRGAARVEAELADQPLLRAEMQSLLGTVYQQLSLYPQAKGLFEKALATREPLLPEADPQLAESYRRLGQIQHRTAQYAEARGYFDRALAIHQRNGDHWSEGHVLNDLANLARAEGDLEKARSLGERLVEIRRTYGEPGNAELAKAVNNLAIVHWRLRDHRRAAQLFEEALAMHRKNEGETSSLVAGTEDNLAMMLNLLGDRDGAKRHSEQALAIAERLYADPHPTKAMFYNSAGFIAAGRGDHPAAIAYYQKSLSIYAATTVPEHPDVAYPEKNLGQSLAALGDFDGALARYRRALALREKAYGPRHPEVASSLLDVAAAERSLGRYGPAERSLRRSVEVFRAASGNDSPRTATALLGLGEILILAGRPAEAKPVLEECLAIRRKALPPGDPAITEVDVALAKLPAVSV
jgi:serine/threonine-protein kinase